MRKSLRRASVAVALSVPLVLGLGAGTAAAAPTTSDLLVPVVTGPEITPTGVPGGLIQTIPIRATVGEKPGEVRFAAADPKAYYYQYEYRYLTVSWRNLSTGAVGAVDLRHWNDDRDRTQPGNQSDLLGYKLPQEVTAQTGAGPVFVSVTQNPQQPPISSSLIPGLGVVFVP